MVEINKDKVSSVSLKLSIAILILIITTGLVIICFEYLSMLIKGQNFDYTGYIGKHYASKVYRIFWLLIFPLSATLLLASLSNLKNNLAEFKLKTIGGITVGLSLWGSVSTIKPVPSSIYLVFIPYLLLLSTFFTHNWYSKALIVMGLLFVLPTFYIGLSNTLYTFFDNLVPTFLYVLSVIYGLICITVGYRFRGGIA